MKKRLYFMLLFLTIFTLVGCGGNYGLNEKYLPYDYENSENSNEFNEIVENPFVKTSETNKSQISLSSNTASYSMLRGFINNNEAITADMVRIEEMVNYFNYSYNQPTEDDVFGLTSQMFTTPWNNETNLLLVGLQTKTVELDDIANNLVLLVDVSGSMSSPNKLPLVQQSMKMLVEQMRENDLISIVTYSSGEKVVLDGAKFENMNDIFKKIDSLKAYGATAGKSGLDMAYEVAEKHYIDGGNNRIILATDGDFNVGITDTDELVGYISEKRNSNIYFSAFGFGYGNFKDEKLESLAKAGNGTYYYIDDELSAKKAFIDDINGTLYTVARDAKAQITFNEDIIDQYRLIGYENRQLTEEEFEDNETDAGEIGTGLQVTAIYEIILKDNITENFATLEINYKEPTNTNNDVIIENFELDFEILTNTPNEDSLFISSVIEFGLILRKSEFKKDASINSLLTRIEDLNSINDDDYKQDFITLVETFQKNYIKKG